MDYQLDTGIIKSLRDIRSPLKKPNLTMVEAFENSDEWVYGSDVFTQAMKVKNCAGVVHAKLLFQQIKLIPESYRRRECISLFFGGTIEQNTANGEMFMPYLYTVDNNHEYCVLKDWCYGIFSSNDSIYTSNVFLVTCEPE